MRIIAGAAKKRRILSVSKKSGVRPISARIRQSLFDILRPWVPGSRFLDLYAGTGAVGLEALSRGASRVVFAEFDPRCLKVIEKNLSRMGFQDRARTYRTDVLQELRWLRMQEGESFDLIFFGPPYVDARKRPLRLVGPTLEQVARADLLSATGWAVAQHHAKEGCSAEGWVLFRQQRYGDSRLSFFRRVPGDLRKVGHGA
ncbi:MAG: 16S rRNA (guanine(966)-N(2))-methyltransferase RsmD [Elusimicrobia bacterium]|nr:16S rRNA (guanine(966)-N(2))-methyltransferase RsmD [Elusimicrobiota bacterium]